MSESRPQRRSGGRIGRIVRSLLVIGLIAIILGSWSAYTTRRDIAVVTGPPGKAQADFFRAAADRPDIATFFKKLEPGQRLRMAQNLAHHRAPELAKLIGLLLADFDPQAREALTASLAELAKAHPEAVAAELKHKGSFQSLAVARALRQAGPAAVKAVAERLRVAETRPNAIAFLVAAGPPAVPFCCPCSKTKTKTCDWRHRTRSGSCVPGRPWRLWSRSTGAAEGDERLGYLTALSGIGAKETEALMAEALRDERLPGPQRAQAALGLGRIGTPSAARLLWSYTRSEDAALRASAISALQLAGDVALGGGSGDPATALEVAAAVPTPLAERFVARALRNRQLRLAAAEAAVEARDSSATCKPLCVTWTRTARASSQDAVIQALQSTAAGRTALERLQQDPHLQGFVARRSRLSAR